jgi:hypothetical protein
MLRMHIFLGMQINSHGELEVNHCIFAERTYLETKFIVQTQAVLGHHG